LCNSKTKDFSIKRIIAFDIFNEAISNVHPFRVSTIAEVSLNENKSGIEISMLMRDSLNCNYVSVKMADISP
jgi:hypothetical protein